MNSLVHLETYAFIGLGLGHCADYSTIVTPIGHMPTHFFQFFGYHSEYTNIKCNVTNPLLLEIAEDSMHHRDRQVFVVPSFLFA